MSSISPNFLNPQPSDSSTGLQHVGLLPATQERPGTSETELQDGEMSAIELKAEMETLLSLRRRSLSQPVSLDPDLPNNLSSVTAPTHSGRPNNLSILPSLESPNAPDAPKSPTAASAAETGTLHRRTSSTFTAKLPSDHPIPSLTSPLPSPPLASAYSPPIDGTTAAHSSQDLFWLPASLHPELAPQEFKAFIREQTRPANLARRVSSGGESGSSGFGSGRIDRKKSMLRGEYIPGRGDGVGEVEKGDSSQRKAISGGGRTVGRFNFDELTIKDLQRLEVLAARAEAEGVLEGEGEGEILGRVLRRSLSLNPNHVAAAAAEGAHFLPTFAHDSFSPSKDDAPLSPDAPLIVPPPGQILRRSARTKIRKAGLVGDGNGHRFGPSRRVRSVSGTGSETAGDSDRESGGDLSVEGIDASSVDGYTAEAVETEVELEPSSPRLSSGSDESGDLIIHIETVDEVILPIAIPLPPSPVEATPASLIQGTIVPIISTPPTETTAISSTILSPFPVATILTPTASPPTLDSSPQISSPVPIRPQLVAAPSIVSSSKVKDGKEKKSGWARLGLSRAVTEEDSKKKGKGKEVEKLIEVVEATRRSQPSTISVDHSSERRTSNSSEKESSFFGGLFSKKKMENDSHSNPTASPATNQAQLLPVPPLPTASGMMGPNGRYTNFYRLPIHVERAVYRLSHIKLANPRRPLYEQVLISNLMFWYLSIINKPTIVNTPPSTNLPIRERQPQPNNVGHERASEEKVSVKEKRPGLSKGGAANGRQPGRPAEQPIKQTKYDEQTQQINQEYPQNPQFSQPTSSKISNLPQSQLESQQYALNSRNQHNQLHSRSVSAPNSNSNDSSRAPDRTSAPADYYRASRTSPTFDRRSPSPPPVPITHRDKSGFEVKSRATSNSMHKNRTKSSEGQERMDGGSRRENARPVNQEDNSYDDLLEAYSSSSSSTFERRSDWKLGGGN